MSTNACCNAQAWKTNAKNLVIKIMRDEVGKVTESDPNKVIVDYISGGRTVTDLLVQNSREAYSPAKVYNLP